MVKNMNYSEKVFNKYVVGNNLGSFSGRGLIEGSELAHISSSAAA